MTIHTVPLDRSQPATVVSFDGCFYCAKFSGTNWLHVLEMDGVIKSFRRDKNWAIDDVWKVQHPGSLRPLFTCFSFGPNNMLYVGGRAGLVVAKINLNWTKVIPFGYIDHEGVIDVCSFSQDGVFVTTRRGLEAWKIALH